MYRINSGFKVNNCKNCKRGNKISSWELKESRVEENGSLRQTYIRKADDWRWSFEMGGKGWKMFDKDGVVELIWIS